mgnify:CR=1 FL=1
MQIPWLLISIGILLIIFLVVLILIKRKDKSPPDYYSLFVLGIIWMGAGIPLKNYALSVFGFILMLVGIVHKDKWKQNQRKWKDLDDKSKKFMIVLMIILGILVLAGLIIFLLL